MSYKKFKFISPGIFINEIDNSQLPAIASAIGPAVIGRLERGPALKPVQVNSFADFIDVFGKPLPGGKGGDVFRYGNYTAPTYAAYAAQAWMRNNSPVTMVRLLGQTHKDASTSTAYAGWATNTSVADTIVGTTNNGAYGLFICEGSSSGVIATSDETGLDQSTMTGTLAAIWYLTEGSIQLSGNISKTGSIESTASAFQFINAAASGPTFKAQIKGSGGDTVINSSFDFDPDSPKFIRKVFNTNPIKTNTDIMDTNEDTNYWLGESFEGNLRTFSHSGSTGILGATPSQTHGIIMRLSTPDGTTDGADFRMSPTKSPSLQFAKTGWFISQDMADASDYDASAMQKLFRFCSRELGEETQRNIKISIKDLKAADTLDPNQYGSFTVLIRDIADTDANPVILEQYNNCNLDPASGDFISRKIGNKFTQWDDDDRRYRAFGDHNNLSNYVYVEVHSTVERGSANEKLIPFGVFGHPRYVGWGVSGSQTLNDYNFAGAQTAASGAFVTSGAVDPVSQITEGSWNSASNGDIVNARFKFPALRLRLNSNEGSLTDPHDAYFGVDTSYNQTRGIDPSVFDVIRTRCEDLNSWDAVTDKTEDSWVFSLDDVRNVNVTGSAYSGSYGTNAVYESGSRAAGLSYTVHTGSKEQTGSGETRGPLTASYLNVIDDDRGGTTAGWKQFTTLLHGGSDGLDITESDPFRNSGISGKTETNSSAYNSISVAIDSLRDPEVVEYNLLTAPGITSATLNNKLVNMCELRGDALAIIDLDGGYKPPHENKNDRVDRKGNVATVVSKKKSELLINSNYGCAYYPWVQIRDTISGVTLWAPPSVVALGAMSYGQANSQLWFAPAGFTRGGLSANRAGGLPVVGVEEKLTVKQRDKLYDAQINPIASFPAEGIVIFGQKTLQITPSALDRINVRRLLIFLKKQVSRFAATILFDQNVEVTWTRFKSKVEPFLSDVKAGLGLTDYKVILDETTTTPDLIDRNIMYAKIYVKPARAIEYIAIDFIITNTGASFED